MTSTYVYKPLCDNEIRLLQLQPGQSDDPLRFSIYTTALPRPKPVYQPKRLTTEELTHTLPKGWFVDENYEGRYLFEDMKNLPDVAQFEHPDPKVSRELWEPALDHIDVGFEPLYDALSYEWGSMFVQEPAVVCPAANMSGTHIVEDVTQILHIGSSLACALRHIRNESEIRTLWVDAICINQQDLEERNKQVPLMRYIFGLARRVILWVGREQSNSSLALKTLGYLARQFDITKNFWHFSPPGASEPTWWRRRTPLPWTEEQWSAVEAFYSRTYFQRVWVIQEMALGNRRTIMVCGHDTISLPDFRRATLALTDREDMPPKLYRHGRTVGNLVLFTGVMPMHYLLRDAKYRLCMDSRDKVYGVMSLAPSRIASEITPDYSLSVQEIYKDIMLKYIKVTGRLDLLSLCGTSKRETTPPTWVPDWADTLATFETADDSPQAAGMSRVHATLCTKGGIDVLTVVGVKVATISRVNEATASGSRECVQAMMGERIEGLIARLYPTGESSLDGLLKTLYLNKLKERLSETTHSPTLEEVRDLFLGEQPTRKASHVPDCISNRAVARFTGASFCNTDEGYFALGPAGAKVGDELCILLGCWFPILLRRASPTQYHVVGSCYAHGLMNAEALLGLLPSPWIGQYHMRGGYFKPRYHNTETNETNIEDPRLGPLQSGWKRLEEVPDPDAPFHSANSWNSETDEHLNSDPRMLPGALERRGVSLQRFDLV